MKIAMVGPVFPYRGGIAAFTSQLSQALSLAGNSVQTISFARQYPSWLYPGKSDRDPSLESLKVNASFLLDPLYPWAWLKTGSLLVKHRPEMVLIQWWTTFWGPAFFFLGCQLRLHKVPFIFVIHNVMPHEERFYDRWIAKLILSKASACITLSPREENRLRKLTSSIKVYPAHLPISRLSELRFSKQEARIKLGLAEDVPILLFFGIVRPYKGLRVLIQALGLLAQSGIRPFLLVAGEFWEDIFQYQQMLQDLDLSAQVKIENRFLPNEETAIYFSAADLFVAPYIGGTQSAAIKIAMDYQLPILASDRIAADLPIESYPFLIHPAGNSQALATDIQKALNQPLSFPMDADWKDSYGWDELVHIIEQIHKHII
jgi:glycosyltransferase involved in cell wall biosynthesis